MASQQRLGEVFVELADTLVADFDVVEFLTTLAHHCADLVGVADAGVVLADASGVLHSVASSSDAARLLDLYEIQNDEGPCLDCYRTGAPIVNEPLDPGTSPWPVFAAEARRLGYGRVHAVPMRLRGQVLGAVNVFTVGDAVLGEHDHALVQAIADVATIALLQERGIREAQLLNERLHAALESRVVIEQAKGMLAERRDLELDQAFEQLRSHARNTNRKLNDVATALVTGQLADADLDRS